MLRKFSVTNFKGFKDKFTLDFTDSKSFEFNQECIKDDTIYKALIYGVNGCGKSNLGCAIMDIQFHLTDWNLHEKRDLYKNYINALSNEKYAKFSYEFYFAGDTLIYEYWKENADEVIAEKIIINNKELIHIDKRTDQNGTVLLKGAESLKTDMAGKSLSFVKFIHNNSVLDDENQENKTFNRFINFVNYMRMIKTVDTHKTMSYKTSLASNYILEEADGLQKFESFLNSCNIKCSLTTIDVGEEDPHIAFNFDSKAISFFDVASTGTLSLGYLYVSLLILKRHIKEYGATFIYIDEFDAFYHYLLAKKLIDLLKNEDGVQAVFTTHNTDLMNNDLMRPDCLFNMTESEINPFHKLTKKDLRKAHNNQKMFKAGMFNEL
ncbi:Transporter [Lentisphaera araneosa HTCC2155]|uniref:Transporter n=1 Tax=Lentisphaera araneosa HTCC2155 TaxID=313628 RepID=A6DSN7_9BACT|nr:ATP-binding protein [Lentisphaera araneosa]EDM25390.1 Transporter [Lentisphaera araneosa HTCC2155]